MIFLLEMLICGIVNVEVKFLIVNFDKINWVVDVFKLIFMVKSVFFDIV